VSRRVAATASEVSGRDLHHEISEDANRVAPQLGDVVSGISYAKVCEFRKAKFLCPPRWLPIVLMIESATMRISPGKSSARRMRLNRGWILAVAILAVSCYPVAAQNAAQSPAVPDTASVKFQKELRLHFGQEFPFQLTLTPTPLLHPYPTESNPRLRALIAVFKRVGVQSSGRDDEGEIETSAPIVDDQSIYNMSVSIPPWKLTGEWKLDSVSITWEGETKLRIPDNVSFEMLELEPISIRVDSPSTVEAGRKYSFTVTLDKYPSDIFPGCEINIVAQVGREGGPYLDWGVDLEKRQHKELTYVFSHNFEPDDRRGTWGVLVKEYEHNEGYRQYCGHRLVRGNDHTFTFVVEPAQGVQVPTSAAVEVNPPQIQLLRGEANRLKAEANQIKAKIASNNLTSGQLSEQLQSALNALAATQARYIQDAQGPSSVSQANVFFGDIRRTYEDARKTLFEKSERGHDGAEPQLEYVSAANQSSVSNSASAAVLAAVLRNVSAYELLISTKHLTFNLTVYSVPVGATIYYRRASDDQETEVGPPTDSTVENLVRATYYIRCHNKAGEDLKQTLDAVSDSRTSVIFRFASNADSK
jgi:hypothetical protein